MQIAGRNALATLRLYGADQSTFVAWAIDDGAPRLIRARAIQSLLARDSSVVLSRRHVALLGWRRTRTRREILHEKRGGWVVKLIVNVTFVTLSSG
jgi:hypothetical protein